MHRHVSSRLAGRKPAQRQVPDALAAVGLDQTVLLPWALRGPHTSTPLASAGYLRPSRTASYLSAGEAQDNRLNQRMLLAVLGMALAYTAIAIANTLVMATASPASPGRAAASSPRDRRGTRPMPGTRPGLVSDR